MDKFLFLDIDGVLNQFGSKELYLDKRALKLLTDFVKKNNVKIVLSSSWRIAKNTTYIVGSGINPYELIKTTLQQYGVEIFDVTGILKTRGDEIDTWLMTKTNREFKYVILDDLDDFYTFQKPYFVKVDGRVGLSQKDINKMEKILND